MQAQEVGCIQVLASTPLPMCTVGDSRTLRADVPLGLPIPKATTSYTVESIPHKWITYKDGDAVATINTDDTWSSVIPIKGGRVGTPAFDFCFYGRKYQNLLVGDNGTITFNIAGHPDSPPGANYTPSSPSGYQFNTPIPSRGNPPYVNSIMMLQDLIISRTDITLPPGEIKRILYFTTGVFPCRAFVATWENVPHFNGTPSCDTPQTYQMVLYESTNIIEVNVKKRSVCNWNNGSGLIGIQDANATPGLVLAAPGRNTGRWTADLESWRFLPNGAVAPVTYEWFLANTAGQPIGTVPFATTQTVTVSPTVTTDYVVRATYQTCDPLKPITALDVTTVKWNATAGNPPKDILHCDNDVNARTFNVGTNTTAIFDGTGFNEADFEINYFTSQRAAETLDPTGGAQLNFTANDRNVPYVLDPLVRSATLWVNVLDELSNCYAVASFKVGLVNCEIKMDVCDTGNNATEDIDLNDYRPLVDASNTLDGLNPADYTLSFHNSAIDADNIATQITPLTPFTVIEGQDIFVRVQKISNPSDYIVKHFKVKLRPNPDVVLSGTTAVCAGSSAEIRIQGLPGSVVNYTENSNPQAPITIPVGGVYTFNTPPVFITYTYELTSATFTDTDAFVCSSPVPQTATVSVGGLPTAAFTTASTAICENDVMVIDVQGTPGTIVTYLDHNNATQQLAPLDALGKGVINLPTTLVPNTTYTYTLVKVSTASTPPCEQTLTGSVSIAVSATPTATITPISTQICLTSGAQVQFTASPNTTINYLLNSNPQTPISIDNTGIYILTEPPYASVGTYTYDLVDVTSTAAPFCTNTATGTVVVTAIGIPTATIATAIPIVCSGGNTIINFSGTPNTTVFYKINSGAEQSIRLNPSATNPAIGENSYTSPALTADTTYQLERVETDGPNVCSAPLTGSVLVTVKPLPTASFNPVLPICTGTSTTVTITGTINSSVTYTDGTGNTTINLGASGTRNITTGVLTADVTYRLISVEINDGVICSTTLNTSVVVRVAPLPTASFSALPNICSNRTAEIDFIGTPNSTVYFTYTVGAGAPISANVLIGGSGSDIYTTIPITAVTTFDLVRVVSSGTPACSSNITGSLTITPVAAPIINYAVTPLEVCDDNIDGRFVVNLDLKKNDITFGNTGLVVTYHETYENSEDGGSPKGPIYTIEYDASPEAAPYYIYVRVEEPGGSTCPSLTRFRVIVNRTPQAVSPALIAVCDDATADGYSIFPDLTVREAEMTAALYVADPKALLYGDIYAFEYYLTQPQAEAGLVPGRITSTTGFVNTIAYSQTIWVRVINTSNSTLCHKVVPMQLIVRELPNVAVPGGEYSLCDDDTEDGYTAFDLEAYKTQITSQLGMSVKYYFDNAAVTSGTELPMTIVDGRPQYINQVPVFQTIVVIVTNESQDTKCSIRTTVTLRVLPRPFITIPAIIPTECDGDGDGSAQFNLDALKPLIDAGAGYTITFHETRQNAVDNIFMYGQQVDGDGHPVLDGSGNPIAVPYPSLFNGNIWIRATDKLTGCYSVAPLQLIVNPVPTVPAGGILPKLVDCDVNDDMQMRLNLRAHAVANLLPQTAPGTYVITLHNSLADAETPTAALIPDTNYPSTNGQIVWVRIENAVTGCYNTANFEVVINPAKYFIPKEFTICDDALPNDGKALFPSATGVFGDLDSLMTGGLSGYDVIYYRDVPDQNAQINPIDKTVPYENVNIPFQNIQVTIIDQVTGCPSISRLTLRVQPLPNPNTSPDDIEECDNGVSRTDGIAENVDLTVNETYIRNGASPTTVALYYYDDLALANADAAANAISNVGFVNAIATPTSYDGPSGTIYVLMTTNPGSTSPLAVKCSAMVQFELIVNPAPALGVSGIIKDFVACVVGSTGVNTFTLSDHNINVIASGLTPSDYTFTYYDSEINAEAGLATGLRPNSYPNGTNPEQIWVRVVNNATTCINVGTFNLVVDEAAVANPVSPAEPLLTTCDNDTINDGSTEFNLTLFDAIILGVPAPANFTIHYYDNEPDYLLDMAEGVTTTNSRAIPDITNYVVTNTQDIIAVVINRTSTTGCPARVDFTLTVNKLPKVTLNSGFFCLDPVTKLPLNTFALTATVDPAVGNYTFEWTKNGAPYAVPDNTVSTIPVNEEGTYSVVVTDVNTGCVSEPSADATVEPTSTAIAMATVTGYFTDNATITVNLDTVLSLGNYEFRLDEGQWQTSNVFSPVATGDHLVQIRDINSGGCDAFIPITVTVINYPKFFTPNGDGYNDKWTIVGLGADAKIYIFDRYGKLVKQISSDPAGGWDGTMNGQMLPSTDYWFKVEYLENNVVKEFKAHFSLKR